MRVHIARSLTLFSWCKYFDLSNVSIPAAVLILQYGDLDEHSFNVWFEYYARVRALLLQLEVEPADRLLEIYQLHLLQFIERVAHSYRDFLRGVGFIGFEVEVHGDLLDAHLLEELDVDEVWLRAVTLPEGGDGVVAQLLHAVAWLGRGERPHGQVSDLASLTVRLGGVRGTHAH